MVPSRVGPWQPRSLIPDTFDRLTRQVQPPLPSAPDPVVDAGADGFVVTVVGDESIVDSGADSLTFTSAALETVVDAGSVTLTFAAAAAETVIDQATVTVTATPTAALEAPSDAGTAQASTSAAGAEAVADAATATLTAAWAGTEQIQEAGGAPATITPAAGAEQIWDAGTVTATGTAAGAAATSDTGSGTLTWATAGGETVADQAAATATFTPTGTETKTDSGAATGTFTPTSSEKIVDQAADSLTVSPSGTGNVVTVGTDAGTVTVTFTPTGTEQLSETGTATATMAAAAAELLIDRGTNTITLVTAFLVTNLAPNGGLEVNATGWNAQGTGVVTVTRDNAQAHSGAWSARIDTDGSAAGQGVAMPVVVAAGGIVLGTIYTSSLWVYSAAGGEHVSFQTFQRNSGNAIIGTNYTQAYVLVAGWQRLSYDWLADTVGVVRASTKLVTTTGFPAAVTLWADDAQIEYAQSGSPYPYVDTSGASPASAVVGGSPGAEVIVDTGAAPVTVAATGAESVALSGTVTVRISNGDLYTQLIGRTNDFANAEWEGYFVKPAITAGQADPFGGTAAFKLSAQGPGGGPGSLIAGILQRDLGGTLVVGQQYTVQAWLRADAPRTLTFGLKDGHNNVVNVTTQWQFFKFTYTYTNTSNPRFMEVLASDVGPGAADWYIAFPMTEPGAVMHPFIPNTGARGTTTQAESPTPGQEWIIDQGAIPIVYTPDATETLIDQGSATATATPIGTAFSADAGTVTITFTPSGVAASIVTPWGRVTGDEILPPIASGAEGLPPTAAAAETRQRAGAVETMARATGTTSRVPAVTGTSTRG